MDVLVLIDKLDDLVHNAKAVPLTDQVRIDREEIYDILDQMRATIPEEIKQARWIVKERQEMLAEAKREQDRLLQEAREQAVREASQTEIVKLAERQAQEIIDDARRQARETRLEMEDWADGMLSTLEVNLDKFLTAVKPRPRAAARALAGRRSSPASARSTSTTTAPGLPRRARPLRAWGPRPDRRLPPGGHFALRSSTPTGVRRADLDGVLLRRSAAPTGWARLAAWNGFFTPHVNADNLVSAGSESRSWRRTRCRFARALYQVAISRLEKARKAQASPRPLPLRKGEPASVRSPLGRSAGRTRVSSGSMRATLRAVRGRRPGASPPRPRLGRGRSEARPRGSGGGRSRPAESDAARRGRSGVGDCCPTAHRHASTRPAR